MGSNIKTFAIRRAILSSVVAGIINFTIVYFSLKQDGNVPLFASVAEIWNHSLIGALIPRSIVISLLITITTVFATLKEAENKKEYLYARLKKSHWIKIAIRKALARALIAFLIVILLALLLRGLFPIYATISVSIIIPLVGIFAALIAFSMTYSAVYSTSKILDSK